MGNTFTASTIPLLLLAACLAYRAKSGMLPVILFMSVFQAASVLNLSLGGFRLGIGPSYLLLLIAGAQKLFKGGRGTGNPLGATSALIAAFTVYAAVSLFVNPWVFEGVLYTNPKFGSQIPLAWSSAFLPQFIYLLGSVALYFMAAYRSTAHELTKAINWFIAGCVLASCVAVYQFAAMKTGLPFPAELLHTNPSYGIFEAYELNGFPRMNATFTEASTAAFFFAAAQALAVWKLFSGPLRIRTLAANLVLLAGLFLTVSTTAYTCFLFIAVVSIWLYFAKWRGNAGNRSAKLLLSLPVVALAAFLFVMPAGRDFSSRLAHTTLLDKKETSSYEERARWNEDALRTASETRWLGAGWGVCRASGILPTMLGNVGWPGVLLLALCVIRPFWFMLRAGSALRPLHGAVLFSLATALLSLLVSGPELTAQIMWVLLAIDSRLQVAHATT